MKRRRLLQGLLLAPLAPKLAALPAPAPVVEWTALTVAQKAVWGRKLFREAALAPQ